LSQRAGGVTTTPTDGELLSRLHQKDVTSLEAVYDRYGGFVYALALRMLGSREEAEEVTQDVFWQLWKGGVRYDPERGRFSAFLVAIARSRAIDRLRRRRRPTDEPLAPEAVDPGSPSPEEDAYRAERRHRVRSALGQLPEAQKKVIELSFFQGMTHSEIADRLGEPLGTVKSRIKMGMDKLKLNLREVGGVR
jgi:RNA polymerase sigma-70 factor (ECF subfamily)